jgi:hypothetical protein
MRAEPVRFQRQVHLPGAELYHFATKLFGLLDNFSRRKLRTAIVMAGMAMGIRLALLPLVHIPQPLVHDEFSYLLGAETFASGRLTNPTPSMWQHFETFHEVFQPTYMSKYPPGQALFLALGWKLLGNAWYGVWISFGFFVFSLCWMLQGWLPPVYALFGTMLSLGQVTIFGYWMNSYWGGAVAAAGGCLVLGALPRLAVKPSTSSAAIAGAGVLLLANSRPFEGLLVTIGAAIALLWWRHKRRQPIGELLSRRIVVPFLAICVCGATLTGYYNYRVTGSPLVLPYALYTRTYAIAPPFLLFESPDLPAPSRDIAKLRLKDANQFRDLRAYPAHVVWPKISQTQFYCSGILLFGSAIGVLFSGRRGWIAAFIWILLCGGTLLEMWNYSHYIAPGAGLVPLMATLGLRVMRSRAGTAGNMLVLLFVALAGANAMFDFEAFYATKGSPPTPRAVASAALRPQPGKHLVLVRYAPEHDNDKEWVFNSANIDASPIIWARDMGPDRNRELMENYRDRTVWLWEPDREMTPEIYHGPQL